MEGCSYYKETSPATQTVCRWALSQREEEGNLLAKIPDIVLKNMLCGSLVMPAVNHNKGCNKRSQKKTPINNLVCVSQGPNACLFLLSVYTNTYI